MVPPTTCLWMLVVSFHRSIRVPVTHVNVTHTCLPPMCMSCTTARHARYAVIIQTVQLLFLLLLWLRRPSHVLVQNPPSIPTLPIAWFVCLVRDATFVIDWHNYGYTILGLALGEVRHSCANRGSLLAMPARPCRTLCSTVPGCCRYRGALRVVWRMLVQSSHAWCGVGCTAPDFNTPKRARRQCTRLVLY